MSDVIYPTFTGPGSQLVNDEAELEFMELPRGMDTFQAPILPEPEVLEGMEQAITLLNDLLEALSNFNADGYAGFDLAGLPTADLDLLNQLLGEGEVSVLATDGWQAQESVLAGVWRVRQLDDNGHLRADRIEIGPFPVSLLEQGEMGASEVNVPDSLPEGAWNVSALLVEINEHLQSAFHSINLSLLPHTDMDLQVLAEQLGEGGLRILSRGYGNCRVSRTAFANVWWVQYFNSQDALILNSIEISRLPDVVMASNEDLADSAERLAEILECYQ